LWLPWILWVMEWVRCFRKLEFGEELHHGEIRVSVGGRNSRGAQS
jgi:hypothetical protein